MRLPVYDKAETDREVFAAFVRSGDPADFREQEKRVVEIHSVPDRYLAESAAARVVFDVHRVLNFSVAHWENSILSRIRSGIDWRIVPDSVLTTAGSPTPMPISGTLRRSISGMMAPIAASNESNTDT
jgi:hypothetical protein